MAEKAVIMERKYPNTETNTAVTPGTTCTKIKLVRTHAPRSANGLIHFGFFARPPVHSTGYINRGNHGSVLHCRENLSRVSLVRDQQSVTGLATLLTPTGRATLSGLVDAHHKSPTHRRNRQHDISHFPPWRRRKPCRLPLARRAA